MKESAAVYGIDKKIQFHHHVDNANYSSKDKTWSVNVTADGTAKKTLRSKFFLLCTGYYDYTSPLKSPIPGLEDFKGRVVHPQFWPADLDYQDKDVVVIGSGATAVTLIPAMAPQAKHITMLQRSPSYLLSQPSEDALERWIRTLTSWSKPLEHKLIRLKWLLVPFLITRFAYTFPNAARKTFSGAIDRMLPQTIARDPHFNPSYNPFEQRVCFCPDGDFYDALRTGKASVETGVIATVTPDTIKLTSGAELHPDIIVTATGLQLRFAGGIAVTIDNKPYDLPSKFVWKGLMLEDLPNAAFVMGYVDASWTLGADATAQLFTRILKTMQREGVVEVVPRRTEEEKKSMEEMPLLRLTSTYVMRNKDKIPKTGGAGQWQPRSYYFKDIWMAWFGDIKTGMEWVRGV